MPRNGLAAAAAGLLLLCAAPAPAQPPAAAPAGAEAVPGELLVRFAPGAGTERRGRIRREHGAEVTDVLPLAGLQLVEVPRGASPRAAAAALEREAGVRYAEPNWLYRTHLLPNDPRFPEEWGLHNTGQAIATPPTTGSPDADVDAPEAWDLTTGDPDVRVAVIDSGISPFHPDLVPNLVAGRDFVDDDDEPLDFSRHGTHVAGTIGARGNNGFGVAGLNWDVELMPLRVCDGNGACSLSALVEAILYAGEQGADVANISLGGPGLPQSVRDALAASSGTLFVASAGNSSTDVDVSPSYPCALPAENLICVAASDQSDELAGFSSFGATRVDLAAPGTRVMSSRPAYDTITPVEDFEDFAADWTVDTESGRAWGADELPAGDATLADSPGADYDPDSDTRIERDPVDLTGRVGCALDFAQSLDVEASSGDDFVAVDISPNGTDWSEAFRFDEPTGGFVNEHVDISALDGAAAARVRFRLESDGSGNHDGIHVDDLAIRCLHEDDDVGAFAFLNGTSFAAPHVAGAAALVLARYPTATIADLRQALIGTAEPRPGLAGRVASGGRLNVFAALTANRGVSVGESGGSTVVSEGGAADGYTVALDRVPAADVTVALDPGPQLQASPRTLTFTPSNWDEPQAVAVTAVDDAADEGPHSAQVGHRAASADALYDGLAGDAVTVQIADNDAAPPATTAAQAVARVSLAGSSVRMSRRGRIPVHMACRAPAGRRCAGTVRLDSAARILPSAAARRLPIGRRAFSLRPRRAATVRVRASRAARRLIVRRRRLRVRVRARLPEGTSARTLTVLAPRRR